jgi:hypothetical protein
LKAVSRAQLQALIARSEDAFGNCDLKLADPFRIPLEHEIVEVRPVQRHMHDIRVFPERSTGSERSVSAYERSSGSTILRSRQAATQTAS